MIYTSLSHSLSALSRWSTGGLKEASATTVDGNTVMEAPLSREQLVRLIQCCTREGRKPLRYIDLAESMPSMVSQPQDPLSTACQMDNYRLCRFYWAIMS